MTATSTDPAAHLDHRIASDETEMRRYPARLARNDDGTITALIDWNRDGELIGDTTERVIVCLDCQTDLEPGLIDAEEPEPK